MRILFCNVHWQCKTARLPASCPRWPSSLPSGPLAVKPAYCNWGSWLSPWPPQGHAHRPSGHPCAPDSRARCCRRAIAVTSIRLWVALLQPSRGPTQALRAHCALQLPGDQPPLLEFLALLRLSHQKARAATRAIHFCVRATTRKTKSCATGQRVRQGTAPSGHAQDKPWMGRRASPSPNKMPGFLGLPLRVFAQEVGEQRCANT